MEQDTIAKNLYFNSFDGVIWYICEDVDKLKSVLTKTKKLLKKCNIKFKSTTAFRNERLFVDRGYPEKGKIIFTTPTTMSCPGDHGKLVIFDKMPNENVFAKFVPMISISGSVIILK